MPWPSMMPPDLRNAVNNVLGARNVEAADIWTEVRTWLIKHGAEAPDLPTEPPPGEFSVSMRDQ